VSCVFRANDGQLVSQHATIAISALLNIVF